MPAQRAGNKRKSGHLTVHTYTVEASTKRASRRAEVEHERATRTCQCPPWANHLNSCAVNALLPKDSTQLSVLEVIERRVAERTVAQDSPGVEPGTVAAEVKKVELIPVKEEPL